MPNTCSNRIYFYCVIYQSIALQYQVHPLWLHCEKEAEPFDWALYFSFVFLCWGYIDTVFWGIITIGWDIAFQFWLRLLPLFFPPYLLAALFITTTQMDCSAPGSLKLLQCPSLAEQDSQQNPEATHSFSLASLWIALLTAPDGRCHTSAASWALRCCLGTGLCLLQQGLSAKTLREESGSLLWESYSSTGGGSYSINGPFFFHLSLLTKWSLF